jgi:putative copper export protein
MKTTPPSSASLLISLAAFVVSLLFGAWHRFSNPFGIWLYTPRNWCTDIRANSFGLAYGLMALAIVVILFVAMIVLRLMTRKSRSQSSRINRKKWASVLTWSTVLVAFLTTLTPLSEWLVPNAPDPTFEKK